MWSAPLHRCGLIAPHPPVTTISAWVASASCVALIATSAHSIRSCWPLGCGCCCCWLFPCCACVCPVDGEPPVGLGGDELRGEGDCCCCRGGGDFDAAVTSSGKLAASTTHARKQLVEGVCRDMRRRGKGWQGKVWIVHR